MTSKGRPRTTRPSARTPCLGTPFRATVALSRHCEPPNESWAVRLLIAGDSPGTILVDLRIESDAYPARWHPCRRPSDRYGARRKRCCAGDPGCWANQKPVSQWTWSRTSTRQPAAWRGHGERHHRAGRGPSAPVATWTCAPWACTPSALAAFFLSCRKSRRSCRRSPFKCRSGTEWSQASSALLLLARRGRCAT